MSDAVRYGAFYQIQIHHTNHIFKFKSEFLVKAISAILKFLYINIKYLQLLYSFMMCQTEMRTEILINVFNILEIKPLISN